MTKERIERLKEILAIQSYSYQNWRMFAFLIRTAKANGWDYYTSGGNIYIKKESEGHTGTFPCVVAHMDTVHKITNNLTVCETSFGELYGMNEYTVKPTGIGGDDKVGIFLALECLYEYSDFKVAFFRDEEVGCVGSALADVDFFDDCSFILQGDRQGNNDFIVDAAGTELSSQEWQNAIHGTVKHFGYDFEYGSITDVMQLKELGVKPVMANVSCGYYNPHTANEYVNIYDVDNCLELFMALVDEFGSTQYLHEHVSRYYNYDKGKYQKDDENSLDYYAEKYGYVFNHATGRWVSPTIGDTGSGFDNDYPKQDTYSDFTMCKDCYHHPAKTSGFCEDCEGYYIQQYGEDFADSVECKVILSAYDKAYSNEDGLPF